MTLRRIFSLLLALVLLTSPMLEALPAVAFAEETAQQAEVPATEETTEATEETTAATAEATEAEETTEATEVTTEATTEVTEADETTEVTTEATEAEETTEATEAEETTEAAKILEDEEEIPVTKIILNATSIELNHNNYSFLLEAQVYPENATVGTELTWTVDNANVASLEGRSSITGQTSVFVISQFFGETLIRVKSSNGVSAVCNVLMEDKETVTDYSVLGFWNDGEVNQEITRVYTDETLSQMHILFNGNAYINPGSTLYVMDGSGKVVAQGTQRDFRGRMVLVKDSTVQLKLVVDTYDSASNYTEAYVTDIFGSLSNENLTQYEQEIVYTGKALKPDLGLYYLNSKMEMGRDYTATYSGNKNIGKATVKITGKGGYEGLTASLNFRIVPGGTTMKAAVVDNGIKLTWTEAKGAAGYFIYRFDHYSTPAGSDPYKTVGAKVRSFVDTEAVEGISYQYFVVPYKYTDNEMFEGEWGCNENLISRFPAVTGLKATLSYPEDPDDPANVLLSWDPVEGATGYNVYRSPYSYYGEQCIQLIGAFGPDETSYLYKTYEINDYTFTVTAVSPNGYEGSPATVKQLVLQSPFMDTELTENSGIVVRSFRLPHSEKSGIEVQRSTDGGKTWKTIRTFATNGYYQDIFEDSKDLASGKEHIYRARNYVKVSSKKTEYSPWSLHTSPIYYLATPIITKVVPKKDDYGFVNRMQVSFQAVAGADRYDIYRLIYDENEAILNDVHYLINLSANDLLTFYDTPNTVYTGRYEYTIVATDTSSGTETHSVFNHYHVNPPANVYTSNEDNAVKVYWDWTEMTSHYEVWRRAGSGKFTKIAGNVTGTEYLDKTAKVNTKYTYKIRTVLKNEAGTHTSEFSVVDPDYASITKLAAPKISKQQFQADGSFTFHFGKVKGADTYDVFRYDDGHGGDGKYLEFTKSGTGYKVTDTDVVPGRAYYYDVFAGGSKGYSAVTVTFMVVQEETHLEAQNTTSGIRLSAYCESDIEQYTVYRSVNGGAWKKYKTIQDENGEGIDWVDTGVKAGKRYAYRVLPGFLNGTSVADYSNTVECTRLSGPKLTLTNEHDHIRLSWPQTKYGTAIAYYDIFARYNGSDYEGNLVHIARLSSRKNTYVVGNKGYDSIDDSVMSVSDEGILSMETNDKGYGSYIYISYGTAYDFVLVTTLMDGSSVASDLTTIFSLSVPFMEGHSTESASTLRIYWISYMPDKGKTEIRCTPKGGKAKTITVKNTESWYGYLLTGLKQDVEYTIEFRQVYKYPGNNKTYNSGWSTPKKIIFNDSNPA